jgi:chemotaxis protein methyltransferase WspC
LMRDAAGDPAAMDYYRKALYLEPNHYETLLQMSLLSQKNGDAARARTFKNRAQRLKMKP